MSSPSIRRTRERLAPPIFLSAGADWRIFYDDTPQVWAFPNLWDTPERHAKWFPLDRFADQKFWNLHFATRISDFAVVP